MDKKILFVSAEVAPYVTVGGLSQVMYYLSRALNKRGDDVRIFTPKYGVTKLKTSSGRPYKLKREFMGLAVPVNGPRSEKLICNVLKLAPRGNDATIYFLENREYYELRANVFGYKDDHTRFALLAKGCLEWLRTQREKIKSGKKDIWWPDVIHCHDWHTAYLVEMARKDRRYRTLLKDVPVVLTVHNFKYQGVKDFRYLREEEKDDGSSPLEPLKSDKLRDQNALLRGLLCADAITTVSPTHALEVLTPEYSEGLLDVLTRVRGKLSGILNGLDLDEFDPAADPIIKKQYTSASFESARVINKKDLQREFGLPQDPEAAVMAFVGRLTSQKGIELIIDAMPHLLEEREDVQLIVLGGGDERFRKGLDELRSRFPDNVGLFLHADFKLPRKIFAGADIILMPSMFEPGGIVALESLRFGAIPIVRRTGGLSDIIEDFNPVTLEGNGFSFQEKSPWSLYGVIIESLTLHSQPQVWRRLVRNAIRSVVTWDDAAAEYDDWYDRTIRERVRVLKQKKRGGLVP
ncbi:hypothetical protein AMJ57_03010 [Parcubacteria bacterium SG8_24]|nr:MAG: hypothetical protein AMJ57_03010 [Parcubacteria bacterium SG8_24]